MGSSPSSVITLTTHRRPWWAWRLIRWARWLRDLADALVMWIER